MADHGVIESYLSALRSRLTWRVDSGDIEAELRDHLYSAVERLQADGLDHEEAQQAVLERFGDPGSVAVAFAATGSRGLAVPTNYTRAVGAVGMLASAAWVFVIGMWSLAYYVEETTGVWERAAQVLYMLGAAALLMTAASTVVTITALHKRHGGLGVLGYVGLGLAGLGTAASIAGWFIYGWGSMIGLGVLLVAGAMLHRGIAPRLPTVVFGLAWLIGGAVVVTLRLLEFGGRDQWGDYPAANLIGLAVGGAGFAAGVWGLSHWLRTEEPVDPAAAGLPVTT